MDLKALTPFFDKIQKACLPGIWSKGVALSRSDAVIREGAKSGTDAEAELVFRVRSPDRPVSPKVTLWPEDEDWYCDCQDRNEVCPHVAAAVISLKTGKPLNAETPKAVSGQIGYRFTRKDGKLSFDRFIIFGPEKEQLLTDSLVAWMGGISSGRIQSPPMAVTREDYSVDATLTDRKRGELDRSAWLSLFKYLSDCSNIQLDRVPVSVAAKPVQIRAVLVDDGGGYRLKQLQDPTISEVFTNGAVLCGSILKGVEVPSLMPEERAMLTGDGKYFDRDDERALVTQILPAIEKKLPLEIQSKKLPQVKQVSSKIVLQMDREGEDVLSVVPTLVHVQDFDRKVSGNVILVSDPQEERALVRKLQTELQLNLGQRVRFESETAVDFLLRVKNWETAGPGVSAFSLYSPLQASLDLSVDGGFQVSFGSQVQGEGRSADPNRVLRAWRENQSFVPLLGGGWAPLPHDWLTRYADRIEDLLAAKNLTEDKKLPSYLLPQVVEIFKETGQPCPDPLKNLENLLSHVGAIPEAQLPADLKADLRPYQKIGVNWLCYLRDAKMGAMLADDMGLGKTLEALCAIRSGKRTLIVSPTSVIWAWTKQIEQFRPELGFSVYYGPQRKLDAKIEVVLTTYGLLRLDREALAKENWNTIIIDEAQVIKNPDSQVTRAVHSLSGDFKLALSGTPLENRLEDLWSQFQFINPGLLGDLDTFQERFSGPMTRGDERAAERLRTRVKPFILRRLKKEVAKDLPPRTEKVLYCELSSEEREIYNAILVSTRSEVLEKLESGGGVFAALEVLLRLRQACCHAGLIPGQKLERSSKLELLIQTLLTSIACGHRALVFSQWTSYLDLIEPELKSNGISYSRLDGATRNRDELVQEFQKSTGPSLMLISLKAGGVGLTLTAADHIFLMDPWWNPAVEDQAADRSHRIGQTNPVLIHRLVAQQTVEEKILELQKVKQALAASVLQNAAAAASITREDLLNLLR